MIPSMISSWDRAIGSERSTTAWNGSLPRNYPKDASGFEDNKNSQRGARCIGKSSQHSTSSTDSQQSSDSLDQVIGNLHDLRLQKTTSGRKTPEWMVPNSNSELKRSNAIRRQTGQLSNAQPFRANYKTFRRTYSFVVTTNSNELARITQWLQQLNEPVKYFGAELVQERVDEHGRKAVWQLTVKTHEQSGGVVTEVRRMLSLMNFEEQLTSPTCCAGWTGTRSEWKPKEERNLSWRKKSGSPVM